MTSYSGEQRQYVAAVEQWRDAGLGGISHKALCRMIGADPAEWRRFREFKRPPTDLFHARVMAAAKAPWASELALAWDRLEKARARALHERVAAAVA